MRLRDTIFGSKSEEAAFRALESHWQDKVTIYPQVPLAQIVDCEPEDFASRGERDFFYKTSIDYTITIDGKPILLVEFDGLGGGFSKAGEYVPARECKDKHRKLKLDSKIRLCRSVALPLIVVSDVECSSLESGESLTILDGIVGAFLARHHLQPAIQAAVDEQEDFLQELSDHEAHEYIQDLAIGVEVGVNMTWRLLEVEASKLERRLMLSGNPPKYRTHEWLYDPPLPKLSDKAQKFLLFDSSALERIKAMHFADRVGCYARFDFGDVSIVRTVWLRNLAGWISCEFVAQEIAEYLCLRHAVSLLEQSQ